MDGMLGFSTITIEKYGVVSWHLIRAFFLDVFLFCCSTAMLAVLGMIVPDFVRVPGEIYSFEAVPKTVDAHDALIDKGPMVQLLIWISLWDTIVTAPAVAATMKGEREAGGKSALGYMNMVEFNANHVRKEDFAHKTIFCYLLYPTDFSWNLVKPSDPATYSKKVDAELRNGRLAMMAIGGIFTQSVLTGHGFPFI